MLNRVDELLAEAKSNRRLLARFLEIAESGLSRRITGQTLWTVGEAGQVVIYLRQRLRRKVTVSDVFPGFPGG